VPGLVGLALTLAVVLVAPAAPASAYVNPLGRYTVLSGFGCLTVPYNGGPGTFLITATCASPKPASQIWHFDRVGTYQGDPIVEIRATHRVDGYGQFTDCVDLPWADIHNGQPLWTQPCRPDNNAQLWRQRSFCWFDGSGGRCYHWYSSMMDISSTWAITANNNSTYPHLVMTPFQEFNFQQRFFESWVP
jgi:hypothetical protein